MKNLPHVVDMPKNPTALLLDVGIKISVEHLVLATALQEGINSSNMPKRKDSTCKYW